MPRLSSSFVILALGLIAAIEAQATAGPKINSPVSLVQCQPAALSWTDATPPVYISAVKGTDTASDPLVQFATQGTATGSLTWPAVNITAGTTITLVINDATGVNNFSGQVTIKDGSSTCNPISSSSQAGTAGASSGTSTGTSGGSSTGSGTTGSGSGSGSSTGSGSTGSTSSGTTAGTSSHASNAGTSSHAAAANTTTSSTSPSSSSSTSPKTSSTTSSTTSGSAGITSAANTVVVGAAAAMAGVLLATGLF